MQDIFARGSDSYNSGNYADAADCFQAIVNEHPENSVASHNLALSYYKLNELEKSLEYFKLPAKLKLVESLISRGVVYRELGYYESAITDFAEAILQDPNSPSALSNYGNSLREYNLPILAIPFLKKAQSIDNNFINAHLNESISYLLAGDLIKGWEKYEYRWYYEKGHNIKPYFPQPEWNGEHISDKTLLIYAEQGLGDNIQFSRFLPIALQKARKIYYASKLPLIEFIQTNYPNITVIPNNETLPDFDYHCALMKLPSIFKTTIDSIPHLELSPVTRYQHFWKKYLGKKTKPRIGLMWRSDNSVWASKIKSLPLEKILNLITPEYEFISLQYQPSVNEVNLLLANNVKVFDDSLLTGISTISGLIANLDLIITNDTFTAHLAPSMGVKTFTMLCKYGVDWRWFLDRTDSPFYPNNMVLFRQPKFNDWDSVIDHILRTLKTTNFPKFDNKCP